ncbi:hypothetical protein T10_13367, partial [Trichinella papuae]
LLIFFKMKWKFLLFNLLLLINIQPLSSVTVKHSYPFDSYRITCPRGQAIQKASLQMIKSRGGQRTDFLITVYCESILKLFPMKMKANQKHPEEECRWTKVVNVKFPILFHQTCQDNEYLSGIMRRGTSQMGFMCCETEGNYHSLCHVKEYFLPGQDRDDIDVEHNGMVVTDFEYKEHFLKVKFCGFHSNQFAHQHALYFEKSVSNKNPSSELNSYPDLLPPEALEETEILERLRLFPALSDQNMNSLDKANSGSDATAETAEAGAVNFGSDKSFVPFSYHERDNNVELQQVENYGNEFHKQTAESLANIHGNPISLIDETEVNRKCNSEEAAKDPRSGLIINCGLQNEIWTPKRCSVGELCLQANDSPFRVCCPVKMT